MVAQKLTLLEYASDRGIDPAELSKYFNYRRPLPTAVGERGGQAVYLAADLDKARGVIPGAVTLDELAAELGVDPKTVKITWRTRYKDLWPEPAGKRGRTLLFDRQAVEPVVRAARNLPPEQGDPDDRLDWKQVVEYLEPVTPESTMKWRRSQGTWPAGVVGDDGVERWRRSDVDEAQARLSARGKGPAAEG